MNGAWARIIARYALGAILAGSGPIGQQIAVDPEIIALVAAGGMAVVEWVYARAKRRGWSL